MSPPEHKFLIIDPDDSARATVRDYLESFGMRDIAEATRLKSAIDLFNAQPARCIICNWDLPGANGLTFLKLIKSQERFREIVFILTGDSRSHQPDHIKQAMANRVDGFLLKPFLGSKLKELLDRALTPK